ncbi:MAG TPA: hypothetical protein VMA83_10620 [Solirubrobacteraceae bacterium]|nr:hypothetical protein [Solirubrobacteraceae bacterium]
MTGRDAHRTGTAVLSAIMVLLGVALIVEAFAHDGVISPRALLGVLFVAAGVLRLRMQRRRGES